MNKEEIQKLFQKWLGILRLNNQWDIKLQFVNNSSFTKTGDLKIDCADKKAIIMLNEVNPKQENMEEVIIHELLHLKMYPLDQVCENLITSNYEEGSSASNFAYTEFFTTLEITVEELTKCFLLQFGEHQNFSYGRCASMKSFNELFDKLNNLD